MEFRDEEKIKLFNEIENLYYKQNFGSTSKADFELLLFSEYIECCISHGEPFDDYSLSKALGITQSRIRSLKERKELKYPHNNDAGWWKKPFAEAVKNAKFNEKEHAVKFIVQDINVMNEVRHYIEEKGWYDECSLNKKLLVLPLDCFTDICIEQDDLTGELTKEAKTAIRKIAKNHEEVKDFAKDFSKEGLKKLLMVASKDVIGLVLQALPMGAVTKTVFDYLFEAVMKG